MFKVRMPQEIKMTEAISIKEMQELIKMKNETPEKYKQFLKDFKEVMKDTFKIARELAEESEND